MACVLQFDRLEKLVPCPANGHKVFVRSFEHCPDMTIVTNCKKQTESDSLGRVSQPDRVVANELSLHILGKGVFVIPDAKQLQHIFPGIFHGKVSKKKRSRSGLSCPSRSNLGCTYMFFYHFIVSENVSLSRSQPVRHSLVVVGSRHVFKLRLHGQRAGRASRKGDTPHVCFFVSHGVDIYSSLLHCVHQALFAGFIVSFVYLSIGEMLSSEKSIVWIVLDIVVFGEKKHVSWLQVVSVQICFHIV